ncbi:hypothetical protein CS542_09510 [Pedobacter sp. IW39]|nr:hypothetical protein CS542_09510 [Pedobacter sp. IW39]
MGQAKNIRSRIKKSGRRGLGSVTNALWTAVKLMVLETIWYLIILRVLNQWILWLAIFLLRSK